MNEIKVNSCQTPITEELINTLNSEEKEQFFECINNIPYIKSLISPHRLYAKDLDRDELGRIKIDITKPHILENMDYFRPSAIYFEKNGCYTKLKPNSNPNSEFGKWIREEIRRCYDGYIRPSDGEWITGDFYFFLNYCPIQLIKEGSNNRSNRAIGFPKVWEGHYLKSHYLEQCRNEGKHAVELASRGKGKSYYAAAMLAKRFILGESAEVNVKVQCVATASEKKYIHGANQILDMFQYYIDFCAINTQFPSKRITSSMQNLQWTMGYIDSDTGARRGTQNSVVGITSKDDESKLRGSRGVLFLLEEAGTFPRLRDLFSVLRPSVEDGEKTFGLIYAYGTAGDKDSDFSSLQELMYNPNGYRIKGINNVYDKEGQSRSVFTYFFPGYINMAGYYDKDGNSDVIGALIYILKDRYKVKYGSTDINTITKRIAEIPITPQEAIQRYTKNIFPVTELNSRLAEIDNNPNFYSDTYVGELFFAKDNTVEFKPTAEKPIRDFPLKDNKSTGALEIYELPVKVNNKIPYERYILSLDNYENDSAETMSLGSIFVLDLWTDRIVAEYTGRPMFADDLNELARKLCLFYNGRLLYENNKKNTFAYFSRFNSLHLLADTPEYLRQRELIKTTSFGNSSKGVAATTPIKNFGMTLIRDWLLKPVTVEKEENGESVQYTLPNLHFLKNRALIKELILYNPEINVDRIMSLLQLMLYREEKIIMYNGDVKERTEIPPNYAGNDKFFTDNYDNKFNIISDFKQ
jgi:hypothetical protein